MREMQRTEISCDVLVVGGGAAALVAALEAKKQVSEVVMVAKGAIGKSGNTILAGSGFSACISGFGAADSVEEFYADTLRGGKLINDEALVDLLARHSGQVIAGLEEYGVKFLKSEGDLVRRRPPGHSRARSVCTVYDTKIYKTRGLSVSLPLREAALRASVRFIENTAVIKLVQRQGVVCGAVGINPGKGDLVIVRAGAVVLATGGGGRLFEQTNNTRDVAGDGFALGLEAGAVLRDMEFVQFYPTMMVKPVRMVISTPLFGDGAVLRNRHGERFLARYDPAGDMSTRDVMSRASFLEIESGSGDDGGVYLDCSGVPEEAWAKKYRVLDQFLARLGLDPRRDQLLVAPTTHFLMGGVKIDTGCRTGVEGLLACGEVTGGVHGANRLSGNALTETAVFGAIAGREAARFARQSRHRPDWEWRPYLQARGGGSWLKEIVRTLRQTMWRHVSLIRSEGSLELARAEINRCREALDQEPLKDLAQWAACLEARKMVVAAGAVILSALYRRESRGSHYREDHPGQDDGSWLGSVEVYAKGGDLQARFIKKHQTG